MVSTPMDSRLRELDGSGCTIHCHRWIQRGCEAVHVQKEFEPETKGARKARGQFLKRAEGGIYSFESMHVLDLF